MADNEDVIVYFYLDTPPNTHTNTQKQSSLLPTKRRFARSRVIAFDFMVTHLLESSAF